MQLLHASFCRMRCSLEPNANDGIWMFLMHGWKGCMSQKNAAVVNDMTARFNCLQHISVSKRLGCLESLKKEVVSIYTFDNY